MESEELCHILSAAEQLDQVSAVGSSAEGSVAATARLTIEGRETELLTVLGEHFPVTKPRFFLPSYDSLGSIPHITRNGEVCYMDEEGMVLDINRPDQIVRDALSRTITTLSQGVTGQNRQDFIEEFGYYWSQHYDKAVECFYSLLNLSISNICRVSLCRFPSGPGYVAASKEDITAFVQRAFPDGRHVPAWGQAIYIPLPKKTGIIAPIYEKFWEKSDLTALIDQLKSQQQKKLNSLVNRYSESNTVVLLLRITTPKQKQTLVGLSFERPGRRGKGGKNSQALSMKKGTLKPVVIQRLDRGYLVARGGGARELGQKSVLLVGCGAVGGHIAVQLAKSGVKRLTLLDSDEFKPENIHRHVLGFRDGVPPGKQSVGLAKVHAIKRALESQLPHVEVTAKRGRLEAFLASNDVNLESFDIVVVATGTPTVERLLNRHVFEHNVDVPVVYTWLEPHGIGGHVLVTNNSGQSGCYECLWSHVSIDEARIPILYNIASFAEANQHFARSVSWCGGNFTPFDSLATVRTAELATRSTLTILLGRERDNPILSWKGDSQSFLAEGYQLSPRYHISEADLYKHRYAYKNPDCLLCQTRTNNA